MKRIRVPPSPALLEPGSAKNRAAACPTRFDSAVLAAQTEGNAALEREILTLFAQQTEAILRSLRDPAVPRASGADLAHKLKGAARAVGAGALAEAAATVETALRAPSPGPIPLANLSATAESALAVIRDHLADQR